MGAERIIWESNMCPSYKRYTAGVECYGSGAESKPASSAGGCSKIHAEALHDLLTKRSFMVNVLECKEDKRMRAVGTRSEEKIFHIIVVTRVRVGKPRNRICLRCLSEEEEFAT